MIELACRLKKICSKYTSQDGAPLWLDVGMDSGPVTGKILGKTKGFWCLFGRPIIGAARMASEAAKDSQRERARARERCQEREEEEVPVGREGCPGAGRADEGKGDEGTAADVATQRPDVFCTENVVRRIRPSAEYGGEGEGEDEEAEGTQGDHKAGPCGSEVGGAGKEGGVRDERWWRRAGRCGVKVVDLGVRCVKGKGEMR
jgi:hypothetical protein